MLTLPPPPAIVIPWDDAPARLWCTALHVTDWIQDEGDYEWPLPAEYAGREDMHPRVGRVFREVCHGLRIRTAAARALSHPDGPYMATIDRLYLIHGIDAEEGFEHHRPELLLMSFFLRTYRRSPLWDLFLVDARGERLRRRWRDFGFVDVPGSRVLGCPIPNRTGRRCPTRSPGTGWQRGSPLWASATLSMTGRPSSRPAASPRRRSPGGPPRSTSNPRH